MSGLRRAFVAIAAALALADASIVALALPPILVEFDTSITGVAAIVGVYALVLALALLAPLPRGRWGMVVFAIASLACALAPNLWLLLLFRAVQGVGAAVALLTAFEVLHAERSRRLWVGASLIGTAAGPAIGGVLTELFDWRVIFGVQVPLGLAAAYATQYRPAPVPEAHSSPHAMWRSQAPLALTAAAFTAVLFLLVLELVAGFAVSPIRTALGVSILPLAALAGAAVPGTPRAKALAGALLLAGGATALAFLPAPTVAWTVVPQLLAGAGMGLALPALSPERDVGEAASNLFARHVGIVLVLAILAPVATARLNDATDTAILQGAGLVLDAQIDPLKKLELAPGLLGDVNTDRPRASLSEAVAARRSEFADNAAVYQRLANRLDDVVVGAILDAFKVAYLIAAALALLAAVLLVTAWRKPAIWLAAAAAVGCAVVFAVEQDAEAPPPVALADPCQPRDLPSSGGIAGAIQQQALEQLDKAACKLNVSREELALAIFDTDRAKQFEADHGVDPRSTVSLLSLLGG